MKKLGIFTLIALNLLLTNNTVAVENKNKKEVVITMENEDKKIVFSSKTYKKLQKFSENKKEVIEKLKDLNEKEADKLYDEYYEKNEKFCKNLMQGEAFFNEYMDHYASDTKKKFQETKKFFNKYGLTVLDTQGGFFLHIPSNFYYNIFKNYVSNEYRDYLELTFKDDDTEVTYMPTGIAFFEYNSITPLTIQEVGEKIISFRNFLDKHPNTKFKKLFSVYVFYILDYIEFSLPYKENENGINIPEDYYKISEKNMKEYKEFIEKHPNELATKCLEYLLKNYKNKKSDIIEENIIRIIKKEMKKEFAVTELWNL